MGARTCEETMKAVDLVRSGKTRAEAARITGVAKSTITRSRLYRELMEEKAKADAGKNP